MKKVLYALLASVCATLLAFNSTAQLRLDGQPYGDLFSDAGSDSVYGTSRSQYTYGYRSSMIYRRYIGTYALYASDTLEFNLEQKEKGEEILYGTAMRYDGSTLLRSYVFVYTGGSTNTVSLLLASDVSQTGTYSVQAMLNNSLYGVRSGGGNYGYGVFFKINKDGTGYTELHHFTSTTYRPEKMLVRYGFDEEGIDETQPWNFVGINSSGGAYGKGAIITAPLDGSGFYSSVDFTGQGGAPNESGDTDGEGPVAIVQDIGTDIFIVTRSGGSNNAGTIFIYGLDGITNIHNFSVANGTPYTSKPFIDIETSTMYGVAANFPGRRGVIYALSLTGGGVNEQYLDLEVGVHNGVITPLAVSRSQNYIIGTAKRGDLADPTIGVIFDVINIGGLNIASAGGPRFSNNGILVSGPTNGKTDVSIKTILQAPEKMGATQYTFLISKDSEFSEGTELKLIAEPGARQVQCPRLDYSTTYWVRVKTDINFYGDRTSFTTSSAEKYSFVSSPANGATDVTTDNLKVTTNVVYGATSYTIELNTSADFTGTSFVKTSAVANQRTLTFNGLTPGTTYYNRTMTNLPSGWGPIRSFTTAIAPPPMEYIAEANEAVSVYPNPFQSHFTIANKNSDATVHATLIDMTGREVNAAMLDIDSSIDIGDDLSSGIYLLKIREGNKIFTHRLIKN
jgi:hypothetical protein